MLEVKVLSQLIDFQLYVLHSELAFLCALTFIERTVDRLTKIKYIYKYIYNKIIIINPSVLIITTAQ